MDVDVKMKMCPRCDGSGSDVCGTPDCPYCEEVCFDCKGSGSVPREDLDRVSTVSDTVERKCTMTIDTNQLRALASAKAVLEVNRNRPFSYESRKKPTE